MYHLKNDKRMYTSARMISEGLNKCMDQKPFEKITISEVLIESTVSRATFYRLFDNLSDVLVFQYDQAFENILNQIKTEYTSNMTQEDVMIKFAKFWDENYKLAERVIQSNHVEILVDSNKKYLNQMMSEYYNSHSFSENQRDYLAAALTSVVVTWVRRGKHESAEVLVKDISQLITDLADIININK